MRKNTPKSADVFVDPRGLKGTLWNRLLKDAHQKRGRKWACGAIIMRNSDHNGMIYM